eukprot:m.114975 g.114975  ORF g.114975 m.114975 type:complete len:141 (+) comp9462_c0_seq4:1369-1791(+)
MVCCFFSDFSAPNSLFSPFRSYCFDYPLYCLIRSPRSAAFGAENVCARACAYACVCHDHRRALCGLFLFRLSLLRLCSRSFLDFLCSTQIFLQLFQLVICAAYHAHINAVLSDTHNLTFVFLLCLFLPPASRSQCQRHLN